MGWFTDAKNWVQSILDHETTAAIGNSLYETAVHTFAQVGTIPKVARSIIFHPSTNKVGKHLLHIIVNDITPMVLVNFADNLVQKHGRDYLDNHKDSQLLSADTVLQVGLYLLKSAALVYSVRKQTEFIVHMTIVTIETPHMANSIKASTQTICDNSCSPIQGSIRDLAAYVATDIAIYCIRYAPGVGDPIAAFLGILHKGRYIASTGALSRLCNDHQVTFLRTYPELAWSLGLTHASISALINYLIKNTTKIPPNFYASAVDPLMLIMLMIVAAHMDLPAAPRSSTRRSIDPVALYQYVIGLGVDTVLLGLKNQIPRMLRGRRPGNITDIIRQLPWESMNQIRTHIQHNPISQLILPTALHDFESFVNDSLISSNWSVVQAAIVHALKMIESLKTNYAIRISSAAPGVSSSLVEAATGTPKFITKLLLQLLTDEQVNILIRNCRIQIEMLGRAADTTLVASYEMIDPIDTQPEDSPTANDSTLRLRRRSLTPLILEPAAAITGAERTRTAIINARTTINPHVFFAEPRSPFTRVAHTFTDEDPTAEFRETSEWMFVDTPPTGSGTSPV